MNPSDSLRFLIVEDHAPSAEALTRFLKLKYPGVVCETVTNLQDGLARSIEFGADLTFLDLGVPLDGDSKKLCTLKEFAEHLPFYVPPTIVITDQDDPDRHIENLCWEYGAANFFSKTFLREFLSGVENGVEAAKLVHSIKGAVFRDQMPKIRAARERAAASNVDE